MRSEAIDPAGISWIRVSPKYVTVRLVGWASGARDRPRRPVRSAGPGADRRVARAPVWLAVAAPVGTLLVCVCGRLVLIPRQVRAIGYAERDEDLLIRRGIFFQRIMVVPYGRMQYVDVGWARSSAPSACAPVKLHTASAADQRGASRACPPAKAHGCANSSPPAAKAGWPGCDREDRAGPR